MIPQFFNSKSNNDKEIAKNLYSEIVYISKHVIENNSYILKKDFKSSFELVSLILFSFFLYF